ncbi:hypothetical protein E2C01_046292 [Portunus trituberculatus]|uniref:Uncharacterized protein n=1 Tax=Portunus trituberculatus TaxID=210409 RepID=A0A5B7G0K2_PORTR|nr:hypothetical protein [Portunus trituberculatus]
MVQWNHARFGVRGVSKCTGSNPVHGPSVDGGKAQAAVKVEAKAAVRFPATLRYNPIKDLISHNSFRRSR